MELWGCWDLGEDREVSVLSQVLPLERSCGMVSTVGSEVRGFGMCPTSDLDG